MSTKPAAGHPDGFDSNFPNKLDRITIGLTPAFLAAARKLVRSGYDRNVGAVAAGAVRDLDGYEAVLEEALNELAKLHQYYESKGRARLRAIEDGEHDADVEEIYQSQHEDDGYAAGIFIDAYVKQVRAVGLWRKLADHARVGELCGAWADEIARAAEPVSLEELRTAIAIMRSADDEDRAWEAARQRWRPSLCSDLENRILSNPVSDKTREALAYCALIKAPMMLARCFEQLAVEPLSYVHLVVDAHMAVGRTSSRTRARRKRSFLTMLPGIAVEIFEALPADNKSASAVGDEALSMLDQATKSAVPSVLAKIVPVLIANGVTPVAAIGRWLDEAMDNCLAKAAAGAATLIKNDELLWEALGHKRADVRETALAYLAPKMPDPLPPRLLGFSSDPGSRVRRALVRILTPRLCAEHQGVLCKLIDDSWSDAFASHNEERSYPIAREAIAGLVAYGSLSDGVGDALLFRAERTGDALLAMAALDAAARCCSRAIRRKIWALALTSRPRWVRAAAINALSQADVVESEILGAITANLLLKLPPMLTASACVLLATHGAIEAVVETMERVASSSKHRALVLLGACGLATRSRPEALRLLALLGSGHPARRLLNLAGGELLPKTVLDDLGDIRIRKAVYGWLDDKIAKV